MFPPPIPNPTERPPRLLRDGHEMARRFLPNPFVHNRMHASRDPNGQFSDHLLSCGSRRVADTARAPHRVNASLRFATKLTTTGPVIDLSRTQYGTYLRGPAHAPAVSSSMTHLPRTARIWDTAWQRTVEGGSSTTPAQRGMSAECPLGYLERLQPRHRRHINPA